MLMQTALDCHTISYLNKHLQITYVIINYFQDGSITHIGRCPQYHNVNIKLYIKSFGDIVLKNRYKDFRTF